MEQPQLGKTIASLRKDQNLSQEDLTERCHVSVRTIQRIESGEVTPRSSTIRILLAALDYEYKDLQAMDTSSIKQAKGPGYFFLISEASPGQMSLILQLAWIAGIIYFVAGFVEGGLDYAVYTNTAWGSMGDAFYAAVKTLVAVSYFFFARGFLALGQLFKNSLLKVSTYLMISVVVIIELGDIVILFTNLEEEIAFFIKAGQSMTVGAAGVIFGIALIRLQDSMGRISGYAGVLEMIIGVSFVSVIFFLVGFVVMIPATILEIILLFRGYEFVRTEQHN